MRQPLLTYIEQATATQSKQFHGNKVAFALLLDVVKNCIRNLSELEAIKKTIFYGKELPLDLYHRNYGVDGETKNFGKELSANTCESLAAWFASEDNGQSTVHGILGAAAETSELLTIFLNAVNGVKEVNLTELQGEMGDVLWYFAIICAANNFDFEKIQEMNIAKLKARYPEGFEKKAALYRNEQAEAAAMGKVVDTNV